MARRRVRRRGAAGRGIADAFGLPAAIWTVAALTAASGIVAAVRKYETRPVHAPGCERQLTGDDTAVVHQDG
jgi:hypothetical protein